MNEPTKNRESLRAWLLSRLGQHYVLAMMILTRLFGSTGGLLVIYYVELTLEMPDVIRTHFRIAAIVVVIFGCTLTVLLALWETRNLRRVLKSIHRNLPVDAQSAEAASREAVTFSGCHHRHESWLVPCSTVVPVVLFLKLYDNASLPILTNITLAAFMGISMALLSTFYAVEHSMKAVIRHLLTHGIRIQYDELPVGRLDVRLGVCFSLIITTTALMIGTLATQRAADIAADPFNRVEAVADLRTHCIYITAAAVITGLVYSAVIANSVASRVGNLVQIMRRVGGGEFSERVRPTGNDEIDILGRQFNAMVEELHRNDVTIRDLNTNLERNVQQRTRELVAIVQELRGTQQKLTEYNEQLELARIEAEAANHAKSDFLANISHELRTPLNGVIGMTDLLLATALDFQQRKYAEMAQFSGHTLLELLNAVLDFSKIEAGKLELENIGFDIVDAVEPIVDTIAHRARDKPLEVTCFIDPAIPSRLRGDPSRLGQILTNLLNNAIKFTEKGSVQVKITLQGEEEDSALLCVSVSDTGIGVPADRRDRLFQMFSQIDASTTRKYGGTGLGLAISKQLCELMGGEIQFQSRQGKGSRFWCTIPFAKASRGRTGEQFQVEPKLPLHVLLVDSHRPCGDVVRRYLSAWNVSVETCVNSVAALSRLRRAATAPDKCVLVLMEWNLAQSDGGQFVSQAKRVLQPRRLFLAGLLPPAAQVGDEDLRQLGIHTTLSKPIRQAELHQLIVQRMQTGPDGALAPPPIRRGEKSKITSPLPKAAHGETRVLLVEDNEINQEVALEILCNAGHNCDLATNGEEAIEALRQYRYDVVLMDCQMSVMDGFEATKIIRQEEQQGIMGHKGEIPIVALTANAMHGQRERCLRAGMTDYLSKPLKPFDLIDTIDRLLTEAKAEGAPKNSGRSSSEPADSGGDSPALASDEELFDAQALLERCTGKRELATKLLRRFRPQAQQQLEEIRGQLKEGEAASARALAHDLQGVAASLSAVAVQRSAQRLERAIRAEKLGTATLAVDELEQQLFLFWQCADRTFPEISEPVATT